MLTVLAFQFALTTSGIPSALKSPVATAVEPEPTFKKLAAAKPPPWRAATATVTGAELLGACVVLPTYTAANECDPAVRTAFEMTAWPEVTGADPIGNVPSKKVTVPVELDGLTVAVSVTVCPSVIE